MKKKMLYSAIYAAVVIVLFYAMSALIMYMNSYTNILIFLAGWSILGVMTVLYFMRANRFQVGKAMLFMILSFVICGIFVFFINDYIERTHMSYFNQFFLPGVLVVVINVLFTVFYDIYKHPPGTANH